MTTDTILILHRGMNASIFDRNEGGKEKIEKLGINHYSIFRYDKEKEDLVF